MLGRVVCVTAARRCGGGDHCLHTQPLGSINLPSLVILTPSLSLGLVFLEVKLALSRLSSSPSLWPGSLCFSLLFSLSGKLSTRSLSVNATSERLMRRCRLSPLASVSSAHMCSTPVHLHLSLL